jgi:hypothetical protein
VSTVFVIQQPRPNYRGWQPDLEPAKKFGTLEYIFNTDDRPHERPHLAMQKAEGRLLAFDPETDFVLWPSTGDPGGVWAVMLILALHFDSIKVLYWERKEVNGVRSRTEGFYIPLHYNLSTFRRNA